MERLTECPDALHTIPWLSVPIQLPDSPANDEEREELWKLFKKHERLTMKVLGSRKGIYSVELSAKDQSMTEFLTDFRKAKAASVQPQRPTVRPQSATQTSFSTRIAVQSAATTVSAASNVVQNLPNPVAKVPAEPTTNPAQNEQLKEMLAEQRKQNKLLERVLGAINTPNSLLTQLVQR